MASSAAAGTKKAALTKLLNDANRGALVTPDRITIATYLARWLEGRDGLSQNTIERYGDIIHVRINPVLGAIEVQKLRPVDVRDWLSHLAKHGGRGGRPLSGRTCQQAYQILQAALAAGVRLDMLSRNVADAVKAPSGKAGEVEILNAEQVAAVLAFLQGNRLYPIAALAIYTGLRRGELCALRWADVGFEKAVLKVQHSLEQTKAGGLRFKEPKSRHGRRTITLPASAVALLQDHRREQLELRMKLGQGKLDADALVFCNYDGSPISPNYLSIMWSRAIAKIPGVPRVSFHSTRHFHASALIAAGIDVVSVSKRLGHSSPVITLSTYAHQFNATDAGAADAIERAMK